jgi:uncharacterized repeat protein (TIGR01451 family)
MKAKLLLVGLFGLLLSNAQAQFVEIPDSNFREFLVSNYPACFNSAKQMDTTCAGIVNATRLDVYTYFYQIADLNGVQYFDKLQILACFDIELRSLPALPSGLSILSCNLNKLSSLPVLPNGLTRLDCSDNQLTSLPTLPSGLTNLYCFRNQLTSLPTLPIGLETINCSENQLTSLPTLPRGLTTISCSRNQLTSLPTLPIGLNYLSCSYNQLMCLPFLPKNLSNLYLDNDKVKCLPNRPGTLSAISFAKYPICNAYNNPYQCIPYPVLKGKICLESIENKLSRLENRLVSKQILRANNLDSTFTFSDLNGELTLKLDTLGSFTFTPVPVKNYIWTTNSTTVSFTSYDQIETREFCLKPIKNVEDLDTKLTARNLARPGFPLSFELSNTNVGTVNTTTFPSFHFPAEFNIDSITGGGMQTSAGTVTWPSTTMSPFQQDQLRVYGRLSANTELGSSLKFYSRVNPNSSTDADKSNNVDSTLLVVRGSFDPNDKAAAPFISPSAVAAGTPIDYTIRFQNTGTDTAFTVVVQDTLSAHLQSSTLEVVATSHNCRTTVKGNVVSFEFFNIHLLWTSFNEPLSHGYIRYRIKPKTTLSLGTKINNRAAIYFDYNKPIITNTVTTEVGVSSNPSGVQGNQTSNKVWLHPNPTTGQLTLSEEGKVEVYDLRGVQMLSTKTEHQTVDISGLPKGIYFLRHSNASGQTSSVKVVKE